MYRCSLVCLILGVATAAGQDAVAIKSHIPQPGERVKVTVEEKTTTTVNFTVMGNTQNKEDVKTKAIVYLNEVLENADKGDRATKLKRTYEKAVLGQNGQDQTLPIQGKTVLIEKSGDKYTFTMDGAAVTGAALDLLNNEFNKEGKVPSDYFLPKKPVKPGESWKIETTQLLKMLASSGLGMEENKATAAATLKKAFKKGAVEFGEIEVALEAPVSSFGPKGQFDVKDGKFSIKSSGEGCIDGSTPEGTMTTKINVIVNGAVMGVDMKVQITGTDKKTEEVLKK
jgi:hypothetical protein